MKDIHVIFDLDDTLIDLWNNYALDNMINTYHELGFVTKKEQYLEARNYRLNIDVPMDLFWRTFNKYDNAAEREKAIKDGKIKLFDDTIPTLERLAQHAELYIVSNTPRDKAFACLDAFNLIKYFKAISCITPNKPDKPDPTRAWEALGKDYLHGQEIWFIGDSNEDVMTGKAMGARTIFLSWRSFTKVKPDYSTNSLSQAADIVMREKKRIYLL